ncbi:hypothetical protein MmiAt1_04410 [Methanimicrococcus sp. At1]|uniref:TPD domain-containing protein n=1 Tax=Methanimicrococcus hacksteinii TaxID=3028293 RepID=A0ABU3VPT7_9EURY|nr:TPD domain-containing protein [Methanimicrococcus sp. At1]MDV0444895.1 hypothetical protein [Methanimicrococcus sp. At1]
MDSKLYHFFYESLHSHDDVQKLSEKYNVCCGTLSSILNQKVVEDVKKSHYRFKRKEDKLVKEWRGGQSFLTLSRKYNYPSTLISTIVLENLGHSKKEIRTFYKNPKAAENARLQNELIESLNADYFFSPRAHQLQEEKGRIGENIISFWLKKKHFDFTCEDEMRAEGHAGKTPDFLLRKSVKINGREICWIESKALFGELKEHRHYEKKQFKEYADCFGEGIVVYWFGFETDILNEKDDRYTIIDSDFFKKDVPEHVNKFLDYVIYW